MQTTLVMFLVNTSPPMGKLRAREHSQEPCNNLLSHDLVCVLLGLPCKHSDIWRRKMKPFWNIPRSSQHKVVTYFCSQISGAIWQLGIAGNHWASNCCSTLKLGREHRLKRLKGFSVVHLRGPHGSSAHTVKTSLSILVCLLFSALSTTEAALLEWVFSASSPAGSPCCPLCA